MPSKTNRVIRASQRKNRNVAAQALKERIASIPPVIASDPVNSWVSRFGLADAASDVVTVMWELPVPPFGYSTSAISLSSFFKSIRIKKIELWCDYRSGSSSDANTINLQILERRGVRPIEWTSTANPLRNAHICAKFPKNDPLGWFYNTTLGESNPEISVRMPKGAIMDIHFDYIIDDADMVAALSTSGLTSYRIYTNCISSNFQVFGRSYQTAFPVL